MAIVSERAKLAFAETVLERTGRTISLSVGAASEDPSAAELAALVLLQRKGRVQDAMSNSLTALRERLNEGDRQLFDQLQTTATQLARLALQGPGTTPPAEYRQRQGEPAAALKEYETALKQTPNRYRAFWGAARAADAMGNRTQASEYFGKLVNLAKNADAERQEVREAKAFLARR